MSGRPDCPESAASEYCRQPTRPTKAATLAPDPLDTAKPPPAGSRTPFSDAAPPRQNCPTHPEPPRAPDALPHDPALIPEPFHSVAEPLQDCHSPAARSPDSHGSSHRPDAVPQPRHTQCVPPCDIPFHATTSPGYSAPPDATVPAQASQGKRPWHRTCAQPQPAGKHVQTADQRPNPTQSASPAPVTAIP